MWQALTSLLAPDDMRSRYIAMFGFSWGIPFAIGPLLAALGFLYLQRRTQQHVPLPEPRT